MSEGHAIVSPVSGVSGQFGTWTVRYVVGPGGIAEGGGIRVQLPDTWHAGPRSSANPIQSTDPATEHYVKAYASRAGVALETIVEDQFPPGWRVPDADPSVSRATNNEGVPASAGRLVKHAKASLDGRLGRYVFVVRVRVSEGRLSEGDDIAVVYGDRSHGSPGYLGAAIATDPEPVLVAIDPRGHERFELLANLPTIQATSGEAIELLLHAPSQCRVGEQATYRAVLLDQHRNSSVRSATVNLTIRTGEAEFPTEIHIPANRGYAEFGVTPTAPGVVRVGAETWELELTAVSNPMEAARDLPELRLYWGDLHSHSAYSWDGIGHQAFWYARHISGLDFYAMTDHSMAPLGNRTRGLSEATWHEYTAIVERHNDPPHFVTIHAYECSFKRPFGHHNVYFREQPGVLAFPSLNTLPGLWELLKKGDALTIPHHTGKFPSGIDFAYHDPELRRNFEIYSGHGLSESYDPTHPLSFEHSQFTSPGKSLQEPTFAQDVWKRGLALSTIASSDDHHSQPGQSHYGLAAVRAPELTRNEIFQALYERHTYGTTGAKIILSVSVDGAPMGQTVEVSTAPLIEIRCAGTDMIKTVELLRWQRPATGFAVIQSWSPDTIDFVASLTDRDWAPGAIYYVRVAQQKPLRGRAVMAWSSPIWTRRMPETKEAE